MDHSLGFFMEAARREVYFEDTIFVFLGDHGLPRRAMHRPPGERLLGLDAFHVPLVIHAPELLEPRVIDKVSAQVDVLPTVLGLTSLSAVNSTFGRDLLDERFDESGYAFVVVHGASRIGVIDEEFYFSARMDRSVSLLKRIFSDDPEKDLRERYPEVADEFEEIAFAFHETLKYMRYHNSPEAVAARIAGRTAE
jgi:arylsulfatase A-like enzyme